MITEYLYEDRVMGSDLSVSLVTLSKEHADQTYATMRACAEAYEQQFSRFLPASELSLLNSARTLQVSPVFLEVLLIAQQLHTKTGGVFNPLVDISRFGYTKDISEIAGKNHASENVATSYSTDISQIEIDATRSLVTLAPGQHLDMGGFLKGHVAQKMAECAPSDMSVIVNIGGDIYTRGLDVHGNTFLFDVEHPLDADQHISVPVRDGGISTSGSYRRHWSYNGMPFFHILDATGTQNPETDLLSATIVSPTGYEADAYATTALILGSVRAKDFCEQASLGYIFIHTDGSVERSENTAP